MDKKLMSSLIENTLNIPVSSIEDMRRTPGGMTNDSYFVTVNGENMS